MVTIEDVLFAGLDDDQREPLRRLLLRLWDTISTGQPESGGSTMSLFDQIDEGRAKSPSPW